MNKKTIFHAIWRLNMLEIIYYLWFGHSSLPQWQAKVKMLFYALAAWSGVLIQLSAWKKLLSDQHSTLFLYLN